MFQPGSTSSKKRGRRSTANYSLGAYDSECDVSDFSDGVLPAYCRASNVPPDETFHLPQRCYLESDSEETSESQGVS